MTALSQLKQIRAQLPPATPENVDLREDMLAEARRLMWDLERPDNTIERIGFQLLETVFVNVAIKMGLFEAIVRAHSGTTAELAKACGADPILTGRVLRGLAANGAVEATGNERYIPNAQTETFALKKHQNAMIATFDFLSPGWLAIPQFLQDKKWVNPSSATDTALKTAYKAAPTDTMWDVMARHPARGAFMAYMGTFNEGHKDWTEIYPVMERLGVENADVMMVDVGGGYGHQAINLKQRFPQLPGRFIVQDLPVGLPPPDQRPSDIEFVEHDFRTPQPVHGARLYYFRYVPHDYSQDFNAELFTRIRKAMKPGFSKLIVNEWIVPADSPSRFMVAQDMNLLSVSGGMERTEALHREYLERAGLRVTAVFLPNDKISEAVIEAEVA